eukprot:13773968-Heterocapsa_arctica.AAC.1
MQASWNEKCKWEKPLKVKHHRSVYIKLQSRCPAETKYRDRRNREKQHNYVTGLPWLQRGEPTKQ